MSAVVHRRYIPYSHAHYGGNLVDGAYALALFGDVVETTGTITRVGNRSRTMEFSCVVVCRARPDRGESAAEVLDPPIVAVTATGTAVVP